MVVSSQLKADYIVFFLLVLVVHKIVFLVLSVPVHPRGDIVHRLSGNVSGRVTVRVGEVGAGTGKPVLSEVLVGNLSLMCAGDYGSRPGDLLILMFGNTAYLPLTQNWLCNTALFPGVHERTLVVVDTEEALGTLRQHERVLFCVDRGLNDARGYSYGMLGYWVIAQRRVHLFNQIIRGGVPVLLVESDALWVSNPLPELRLRLAGTDLVLYDDGNSFGMGLLMVRGNEKVWRLFDDMGRLYDQAVEGARRWVGDYTREVSVDSEQAILTRLIKAGAYGLTRAVFPPCKFVNGQWYDGGVVNNFKAKRVECGGFVGGMPLMIQNNWIVGIENKVRRAKRWGHWFVRNESTGSCGSEAGLRRLLDVMETSVRRNAPS